MINLLEESVKAAVKESMAEMADKEEEKKAQMTDKTESEFFAANPEIAAVSDKMKNKNERHPLYDLKSWEQEKWCIELAELILKSKLVDLKNKETLKESLQRVYDFEYHCYAQMKKRDDNKNDYGLLYFLGFNLARSRLNMLLLKENGIKSHITVIVPMWGEQNRMQTTKIHKNGEDFIRRKVFQLDWIYKDINSDLMDFNLMFVDDGCPHNSGNEAIKLIENDDSGIITKEMKGRISIEFLAKGLETIDKFKNDDTLKTVNDSRKGGAVQYGMYLALNQKVDKEHFIMYTDADLSSNISQIGLLLSDITINNVNKQRKVVIGDRYSKGIFSHGYIMGTFKTNEVALKLRAIFRGKLLPPFRDLYDTQCGFKIFNRECIGKVLPELKSYQGMFDMELLLKSFDVYVSDDNDNDAGMGELIYSTGIVWLHSAEETAFGAFNSDSFTNDYGWKHYNQLQQIIKIHKDNYAKSKLCDAEWIKFILDLSWKDYFKIAQVAFCNKYDVHTWSPKVADLNKIIKDEKYPEKAPKWIENMNQKK